MFEPPGARSDQGVRLRELRHQPEGPLVLDLDLLSRRQQVGGEEDHQHPGRAGERRRAAAGAQGFLAPPRWSPTSNLSMDDRFLRGVLGNRRPAAIRRSDPFNPKLTGKVRISGIVARRPSGRQQLNKSQRRPADGRGQPRWAAVYFTNCSTAPSIHNSTGGFDGWMIARRRTQWQHRVRFEILRRLAEGPPPAPVRLQGNDCSSDSYCYP